MSGVKARIIYQNPIIPLRNLAYIMWKNFVRWPDHLGYGWVLIPSEASPIVLACYNAKFGGPAAMSPIAESLTENFAPFQGAGGQKLNLFVLRPIWTYS